MACQGTTKAGKACKAAPLKGGDYCLAHSDGETQESVGFGGSQPGAGRPRLPRPHEEMRRRIEEEIDAVLEPYFDAMTGAMAHTAYEGEIFVSTHPDYGARINAAEKLLDRVYGKPKQATELTGAEGGPIEHASVDPGDPETRRLAHELLLRRARPQE